MPSGDAVMESCCDRLVDMKRVGASVEDKEKECTLTLLLRKEYAWKRRGSLFDNIESSSVSQYQFIVATQSHKVSSLQAEV